MMRTYPIVLKQLQEDQGIPGGVTFGKRMRLASEGIESITQSAIDSLNMYGSRFGDHFAQDRADLHREESAMFIAMFDALRQTHIGGHNQLTAATRPRHRRGEKGLGHAGRRCPPRSNVS